MDNDDLKALSATPDFNILLLVKVGRKEHMLALRDGKLFCRRLSFYTEIEGKPLAYQDAHEGLAGVYQSGKIEIVLQPSEGDPIIINSDTGLIGHALVNLRHDNPVFCLHSMHDGAWAKGAFDETELEAFKTAVQIPASMDKFGDHVWLIANGAEFLKRVGDACDALGIDFRADLVRYVDPARVHITLPRNLMGFVKLNSFAEEREYRLFFESERDLGDPFILDVGSLHDISHVLTLAEFREGWSIQASTVG